MSPSPSLRRVGLEDSTSPVSLIHLLLWHSPLPQLPLLPRVPVLVINAVNDYALDGADGMRKFLLYSDSSKLKGHPHAVSQVPSKQHSQIQTLFSV